MSNMAAQYPNDRFWNKAKKFARVAGEPVLGPAFKLYYACQDPDTPAWAKTVIAGAIAYFISPVDAIPDLLPVIGYTDDIGVLLAAVGTVAMHIKPEHVTRAKQQLDNWFA